jgi:ATP citrate (pro-S)-lyase
MTLIITADHGPAVSGAHNTIVCARAGKDLVSCLASGLLTIVRTRRRRRNFILCFVFI